MLTPRRRRFAALTSAALLAGAVMAVIVVNPVVQFAGAAGNAVVPNSAISGFTPTPFPGNDDGTYNNAVVPFGFDINFLGTKYSGAYINNNGNLTFDSPLPTYTPFGLQSTNRVIVAAFFADVDTRVREHGEFRDRHPERAQGLRRELARSRLLPANHRGHEQLPAGPDRP